VGRPAQEDGALLQETPAQDVALRLARNLADDRCRDILVLDLRSLSGMADFFVIATGTSDRQIRSAVDHAADLAASLGRRPLGIQGREYGHWVLLDFVDVVVHVFCPDYRQIYDLELLWGDAPRVEWDTRPAPAAGS